MSPPSPRATSMMEPAAPPRPVSTSVNPSSSRTRKAFTKCARVSWKMFALTGLAFIWELLLSGLDSGSVAQVADPVGGEGDSVEDRDAAVAERGLRLEADRGRRARAEREVADELPAHAVERCVEGAGRAEHRDAEPDRVAHDAERVRVVGTAARD